MGVQVKLSDGTDFDLDDFATDPKLETEGVWRPLGKDAKGRKREIRIARAETDDYNGKLRKLQKDYSVELSSEDDDAVKAAEHINRRLLADHCVKGLRVMEGGEWREIAITPDEVYNLLKNRDFHAKVRNMANQMEPYKLNSQKAEELDLNE